MNALLRKAASVLSSFQGIWLRYLSHSRLVNEGLIPLTTALVVRLIIHEVVHESLSLALEIIMDSAIVSTSFLVARWSQRWGLKAIYDPVDDIAELARGKSRNVIIGLAS